MQRVNFLRKKHSQFIYKGFKVKPANNNLKIVFVFKIQTSRFAPCNCPAIKEPDIYFHPQIIIKNVTLPDLVTLDNLIFHLGLMEIPSYWKATCSPEIVIEAGYLNKEQTKWWKDLIIKGMGQFFYENKIDWRPPNFLKIKSRSRRVLDPSRMVLANRYLVPVGGGKDSIVTLEKLKKQGKGVNAFIVNPTTAAKKVLKITGIKKPILVERKIDPLLLKLNRQGFLNGHTPFTAVLSFLSVFCAVLFNYKHIAFSNEKSADEGNLKYLDRIINHQYSKSSEFERKFKTYCQKYLAKNVNYFSFLRKYTELEIAKMFTKYPKYFSVFSSCNAGAKVGERWCGKCPKCLFVYAALYPYLDKKRLIKIFGKDLFEDKKLLPIMKSLMGQPPGRRASPQRGGGSAKPFECVGTYKESRKAFNFCLKKAQTIGKVPYLLTKL